MRKEIHVITGEITEHEDAPVPILSAEELAAQAAIADALANKQAAKADAFVNFLATKSPAEVAARIQADVTDLASARVVITKLAIAVSVLARNELA
jgi:hypothetical protein